MPRPAAILIALCLSLVWGHSLAVAPHAPFAVPISLLR